MPNAVLSIVESLWNTIIISSVSTKGKSVVNLAFILHENLKSIHSCYVDTCSNIINNLGIEHMNSDICKAPDHSLVTVKVYTSPNTARPNLIHIAYQKIL